MNAKSTITYLRKTYLKKFKSKQVEGKGTFGVRITIIKELQANFLSIGRKNKRF